MRKRLYEIIERPKDNDLVSKIYDLAMMFIIFTSLIPLAFKTEWYAFQILDKISVSVFIIDYLLRWATADYKYQKSQKSHF